MIRILLIIMFLFVGMANATTYYVSPDGNDSDSGSISEPFKTIQKSADVVVAGDTVIVKPGTYTCSSDDCIVIDATGTEELPIKFISETKWAAVIDGEYSYKRLVLFGIGASWIVFEGFELKRSEENAIHVANGSTANHIEINDNYIHHVCNIETTVSQGRSAMFLGNTSSYFTVRRNYAHDIGRTGPSNFTSRDHFIYAQDGGVYHTVEYNIVEGCNQAIAMTRDHMYVRNNILTNGTLGNPSATPSKAVLMLSLDHEDIIIENNIFYDIPAGYSCIWNPTGRTHIDVYIRNNICDADDLVITDNSTFTFDDNFCTSTSEASECEEEFSDGDIGFIDASTGDWRLEDKTSIAHDAGYDWGGTIDFIGNPMVNAPDIGSYEYCIDEVIRESNSYTYPTILSAYYASSTGETLLMPENTIFIEDLDFDRNITATVEGGLTCDLEYQVIGEFTLWKGDITISDGTINLKDVYITED